MGRAYGVWAGFITHVLVPRILCFWCRPARGDEWGFVECICIIIEGFLLTQNECVVIVSVKDIVELPCPGCRERGSSIICGSTTARFWTLQNVYRS
jgi:hypothetical protein